jgi:hypothetical protein
MLLSLTALFVLPPIGKTLAAETRAEILVNGEALSLTGNEARSIEGKIFVPVKEFFEALGFKVTWNGDANIATLAKGDYHVTVIKDAPYFTFNAEQIPLESPAPLLNGSLYAPLRDICDAVGIAFVWDEKTSTASITLDEPVVPWTGEEPVQAPAFTALTPAKQSALADAVSWAKTEYAAIEAERSSATQEVDFSGYQNAFASANDLFKAGEYTDAKWAYADILTESPLHLGARNNYVLALSYCGEYESALNNSILLGLLHPSYEGNWVNILIPLYALGYDPAAYGAALSAAGFPSDSSLASNMRNHTISGYVDEAYAYNRVYMDMEAAYDEDALADKMAELNDILQTLQETSPDDTDYSELLAYFEGLEKIRTDE